MKNFKKSKIKDLSKVQGGVIGKKKLRRTLSAHNFFDGEFGNECLRADLTQKG